MSDIVAKLKKFIAEYPDALSDQEILKPLLRDYFFPDKLSGNVLGLIFESGIVDMAIMAGHVPANCTKVYVDSFVNDFGMRPEIATMYITIWLDALGLDYEMYEDKQHENSDYTGGLTEDAPEAPKKDVKIQRGNILLDHPIPKKNCYHIPLGKGK